ncbi:TetR/AcrR family transcriptional regulator [Ochrobactrum sp. S46]|nr:TetR/AcrR family transcriptional regulator [Ochrobactrum sp. S45]MBK0046358.1 TetR/AcrR family transcriptional regulator [Ochrobactrum sp. S46]
MSIIILVPDHFGDKERLWNPVCKFVFDDFLEFLDTALEADHIDAETIPDILMAYTLYWRSHPSTLLLQIWCVRGAPEDERRARIERLNQRSVQYSRLQEADYVRNDVSAGQAMVTAGSVLQYRLHSELEMKDAASVTGVNLPDDQEFLRYRFTLIAPRSNG